MARPCGSQARFAFVGADGVTLVGDFLGEVRISSGHAADVEERRFRTLGRQCSEDCFGVAGEWAVIKGEHHFTRLQQMVAWILLSEPRPACCVDLGHARNAESISIGTGVLRLGPGRGRRKAQTYCEQQSHVLLQ